MSDWQMKVSNQLNYSQRTQHWNIHCTLHIWAFLGMFSHFKIVLFSSFGWSQEITNSFIVYFKITNNHEKIINIFLIKKVNYILNNSLHLA